MLTGRIRVKMNGRWTQWYPLHSDLSWLCSYELEAVELEEDVPSETYKPSRPVVVVVKKAPKLISGRRPVTKPPPTEMSRIGQAPVKG